MTTLWKQAADNLTFVAVCIAVVAGLALLARVTEHFLPEKRKVSPARRVSIIGICAAIATVLHVLDFPLIFLQQTSLYVSSYQNQLKHWLL